MMTSAVEGDVDLSAAVDLVLGSSDGEEAVGATLQALADRQDIHRYTATRKMQGQKEGLMTGVLSPDLRDILQPTLGHASE